MKSMRALMNILNENSGSFRIGGKTIPIRPPTDDIYEVLDATFLYGEIGEATLMPMDQIHGGVMLDDPAERRRIDHLKSAIMGDDGFCARLIVDQDGNVIEGQHRCEALRELGAAAAPVQILIDLGSGIDMDAVEGAINQAQPMHMEHCRQIIAQIMNLIHKEGSIEVVRDEYDPPRGFAAGWNAAIEAISRSAT